MTDLLPKMKSQKKPLLQILATFFLYYVFAKIGLNFATINDSASPFWPASGIAIGFILKSRFNVIGVAAAAFLANFETPAPISAVLMITLGNTLEGLLGAEVFRRCFKQDQLSILKTFSAALIGSLISAGMGLAGLYIFASLQPALILDTAVIWIVGNTVGSILIVPIFTVDAFAAKSDGFWTRRALIYAVAAVVCAVLFMTDFNGYGLYALLLPVLGSSIFLSKRDTHILTLMICVVTVLAAASGKGPFVQLGTHRNLVGLQIVLLSLTVSSYFLPNFAVTLRPAKYVPILLFGWLLSGLLFDFFRYFNERRDEHRFLMESGEIEKRIESRMMTYVDTLTAAAGVFASQVHVTRDEWKVFAEELRLTERYPGINGIGAILPVKKNDAKSFEIQLEGDPSPVKIKVAQSDPEDQILDAEEHYVIQYIEPMSTNKPALGLDIGSEKRRRQAADEARDRKAPTISRHIRLIQENSSRPGFLLFVPIFKGPEKDFFGWTYAPFVFENLIKHAVFGKELEVDFKIYEKNSGEDAELFSTGGDFDKKKVSESVLRLLGNEYHFKWVRSEGFQSSFDFTLAWIGAFGVLLTLAITHQIVSSKTYATRAAEEVERKTKEISEKERNWRTLTEVLPVGVFRTNNEGQILYANKKWFQMLCSRDMKLSSEKIVVGAESFRNAWHDLHTKQMSFESEIVYAPSPDSMYFFRVSAIPLNMFGQSEGAIGVLYDQTAEKKNAEQLEKERAKSVQASKLATLGEMAGGIAHEINNPLATIISGCAVLRKTGQFSEQHNFLLSKIEATSFRISKIVKGLRNFSRNGENDPFENVDLASVVSDVLELCRERFQSNAVVFNLHTEPLFVLGRSTELAQVVLNLLNNAYDATDGQVVRAIGLSVVRSGSAAVLKVTDNGTGISSDVAVRIMEPFFTTKPVGKGTGLGLSICKGIIENHKGTLEFSGEEGKTTFTVSFPLSSQIDVKTA